MSKILILLLTRTVGFLQRVTRDDGLDGHDGTCTNVGEFEKTKPWTNQAGTWTILDPLDLRTLLYPPSDEMYLSEQTCQMHHQSPWFL
ncbi:MAG: hypothetical protein NXY57DRAFT_1016569 [Lentinula lateritia]|nr:MAG: hypothetical protein NXY57DRAFT_1016554 [Lentinula lateritia]KAJ3929462.1 MAG: hypothetical protein NXY57DRAFT_1016569 [Lentinula lateritia]